MYKLAVYSQQIITETQNSLHKVNYLDCDPIVKNDPLEQINTIQKITGNIMLYICNKSNGNDHEYGHNILVQYKSRVILFVDPPEHIVKSFHENLQEIQNFDIIMIQGNQQDKGQDELQPIICYLIIFKSFALAQDYSKYIGLISENFVYFYLQDCSIFCGNINQPQIQDTITKSLGLGDKWMRIPFCPKCLQLLESQVSGFVIPQAEIKEKHNCKVCFYRENKKSAAYCQQCSKQEDIWICLICGARGCGRYKNADAQKHYRITKHPLSYKFDNGEIWNYHSDCFSHKIIGDQQHEIMMEMVEDININEQNIQQKFWQYCGIISEQLQEQRAYYTKLQDEQNQKFNLTKTDIEDRISQLNNIRAKKQAELKKREKKNNKQETRNKQLKEQCQEQRIILSQLQETAKMEYEGGDQQLLEKKKRQLEEIEKQIGEILMNLG